MKKNIFLLASGITVFAFMACNSNNDSTTNTDSTSTTETVTTNESANRSYVNLSTGSSVKIRKDSSTGYAVNEETNEPVYYYIDISTHDTFDRSGRIVNNALTKGTDGSYNVDESRIKVKTQDDGDLKMKDEDSKVKVDADGNNTKVKSDDYKMKSDEEETKIKTDSSKVKMKH
jgi:hypothetical protein